MKICREKIIQELISVSVYPLILSRKVNSISSRLISTKKYLFGLVIDFCYINNCTGLYEGSKYYDLNTVSDALSVKSLFIIKMNIN